MGLVETFTADCSILEFCGPKEDLSTPRFALRLWPQQRRGEAQTEGVRVLGDTCLSPSFPPRVDLAWVSLEQGNTGQWAGFGLFWPQAQANGDPPRSGGLPHTIVTKAGVTNGRSHCLL